MKITKPITIDTEVDVHISAEDIANALAGDGEYVLVGINNCAQFLKAVTESQIEHMNVSQKVVIAEFLKSQATRFSP